jgi:WD40 repeat protein
MAKTEQRLISAAESLTTLVHNVETGQVEHSFRTPEDISALRIHSKQPHSLYYSSGKSVYLYDLRSSNSTVIVQGEEEINDFDVHDTSIVILDDSGLPYTFALGTKQVKRFRKGLGHSNIGNCVRWRPTCRYEAISGGCDATCILWDSNRGSPLDRMTWEASATNPPWVYSVAFSQDGNRVALGLGDGSVSIHRVERKKPKLGESQRVMCHDWTVSALLFHQDVLVTGGLDQKLCFLSLAQDTNGTSTSIPSLGLECKVNCLEAISGCIFVGGTATTTRKTNGIPVIKQQV